MLADAQVRTTLAMPNVLGLSSDLGAADLRAWRDVAAAKLSDEIVGFIGVRRLDPLPLVRVVLESERVCN